MNLQKKATTRLWMSNTPIKVRGTLEIIIQEVLCSIRGSYSAIWIFTLTNVKWHSDPRWSITVIFLPIRLFTIFMTLIPSSLTLTELRVVPMEHLQQVWHASRELLPFRTPGSVPLGTCLCSNCWDQFSRTRQVFSRLFNLNILWYVLGFAFNTQESNNWMMDRRSIWVHEEQHGERLSGCSVWKTLWSIKHFCWALPGGTMCWVLYGGSVSAFRMWYYHRWHDVFNTPRPNKRQCKVWFEQPLGKRSTFVRVFSCGRVFASTMSRLHKKLEVGNTPEPNEGLMSRHGIGVHDTRHGERLCEYVLKNLFRTERVFRTNEYTMQYMLPQRIG